MGIDLYDGEERSLRCEPAQELAVELAKLLEEKNAAAFFPIVEVNSHVYAFFIVQTIPSHVSVISAIAKRKRRKRGN